MLKPGGAGKLLSTLGHIRARSGSASRVERHRQERGRTAPLGRRSGIGRTGARIQKVLSGPEAALLSLARTLSGELIVRGIRVNAISPGPIATPLYSKLGLPQDKLKAVADSIQGQVPAGRFGSPSEIADAVVFLASDEAAFTVGSELLIDGGMSNL